LISFLIPKSKNSNPLRPLKRFFCKTGLLFLNMRINALSQVKIYEKAWDFVDFGDVDGL